MKNSEYGNKNEALDIVFFNLNTGNKESLKEHSFTGVRARPADIQPEDELRAYRENLKEGLPNKANVLSLFGFSSITTAGRLGYKLKEIKTGILESQCSDQKNELTRKLEVMLYKLFSDVHNGNYTGGINGEDIRFYYSGNDQDIKDLVKAANELIQFSINKKVLVLNPGGGENYVNQSDLLLQAATRASATPSPTQGPDFPINRKEGHAAATATATATATPTSVGPSSLFSSRLRAAVDAASENPTRTALLAFIAACAIGTESYQSIMPEAVSHIISAAACTVALAAASNKYKEYDHNQPRTRVPSSSPQ